MTTKTEIVRTVLIVWFLAATSYVAYDIWNEYKVKGIQASYRSGVENTVNELIKQVEGSNCQAVDVFIGEKKLQVVNAACIQQPEIPTIEEKK